MTSESERNQGFGWTAVDRLRAENVRLREEAANHALLLRESDHRVKNCLQVVAAILQLQARREQSAPVGAALASAASRIQSIARIHDMLQASVGDDVIDLGAVIEALGASLQAMAGDPGAVTVHVEAEPVEAPAAMAQPIALAVNELVVNALRHAFPDGRAGAVRISLEQEDGRVRVAVADDGQGLPEGYPDGGGYGLTLVRAMVSQIGGELLIDAGAGARFTIEAPIP